MSKSTYSNVWSVRNRIVFSITGLLLLFLAVTVIVSRYQVSKAAARGAYLDKHLGRLEAAVGYVEASLGVAVTTIAMQGELARCLALPEATPGAVAEGQPQSAPRCDATARWSGIVDGLQATLAPELTLLTDVRDVPVGKVAVSLTPERLRRELFYQQVSQGMSLTSWVQLGGEAYVASGARITDARGQRVGTVIVGIRLSRMLRDFAVMSDSKEGKRQQLFVVQDGATLGSSFPGSVAEPDQLSAAFANGRRKQAEGSEQVDVIRIGAVDFDYAMSPRRVFVGNEQKRGDLVMARLREAHEDKQDQLELPILLTGAISLALSVVLGLLLARRIVEPLRSLIGYTEQMARGAGDLTHRFPEGGNDELAHLARNLNGVLDQLQALFSGVKTAALEVGNSAAEISVTAGQLHQRSRDESTKVEEITTAVSEMNVMIQQLSVNAQQAADHARTGGEGVGEASAAILNIRKTVVDVSEHVQTLGERSARIGNIVETIGQIADQTSLLALNASIEAAHAGEHGKGFAVVANEVSNLAERVNKSARQIEEQLAQIRLLTEQAVRTMQQATSTVDAGVVKVDSTFRGLNAMIGLVQEIGEREKEQASVSDNIARNMEDIFLIVREGLSASEQTVREGDRLKKLGEALLASVERFKTTSEAGRRSAPSPTHLALSSRERSAEP